MKEHRVKPGSTVSLDKIDADDTGDYLKENGKAKAQARMEALNETLAVLQQRLYANGSRACSSSFRAWTPPERMARSNT